MKDTLNPLNKDVIVYCGMDHGIDGRDKGKVMYAYLTMPQLQGRINDDPNKAWRTVEKRIVNLFEVQKAALRKLDAIEIMALAMKRLPA